MIPITSTEELDSCLRTSEEQPVLIFKHSTACPISGSALYRFERFISEADVPVPPAYMIKVIQSRAVSNAVAERLGVRHASPQLLLVHHGRALWSTSHMDIGAESISAALAKHLG